MNRQIRKHTLMGILFVAPSLIGFMVFFIAPFCLSIFFTFMGGTGTLQFVGLHNYADLLGSNSFRMAVSNMFGFIAMGVPLLIAVSLLLALLFSYLTSKKLPFVSALFTTGILPMVIPSAAIILFVQILFERYGTVNYAIVSNGLPPVDWLRTEYAFYILLAVLIWKNSGYCMIIFFARLGQIDKGILEAASLDGAGWVRKLIFITLPCLMPALVFNIIMGIVSVFKIFRESYLLVGNYPNEEVYMFQNFLNNNFLNLNYTRLSSATVVFLIPMAVLILGLLHVNARYDG